MIPGTPPPWLLIGLGSAVLLALGGGGVFLFNRPPKAALAALTVGLAVMVGSPLTATAAGANMFLQLDGVSGESTDVAHPGAIQLTSIGPADMLPPKPGTSAFGPIQVAKSVDSTTPVLFGDAADGHKFKCAFLFLGRSSHFDYLIMALSDVTLISFQQEAAVPDPPTETLQLRYGVITWRYQPLGPDGSPQGAPIVRGWDPVTKKAITP